MSMLPLYTYCGTEYLELVIPCNLIMQSVDKEASGIELKNNAMSGNEKQCRVNAASQWSDQCARAVA